MVTIRISVILQILHTFVPGGNRNFVWWTGHILLWVNLLSYGAFVIIELNTCKPRAKEWDPTIEGGKCLNLSEVRFVIAILNVFSDLIMMILPQRIIWGLSLPPMRKLKLSILFLFGILYVLSLFPNPHFLFCTPESNPVPPLQSYGVRLRSNIPWYRHVPQQARQITQNLQVSVVGHARSS